jgi:hypothetical protein
VRRIDIKQNKRTIGSGLLSVYIAGWFADEISH